MAEKGIQLANRLALRPKEAADALGVSERTLRTLGTEIPRILRGNVVLYPVEGLKEWLRRHAKASDDPLNLIAKAELDALSSDS